MNFEPGQRVVVVGCQTHPQANGVHATVVEGPRLLQGSRGNVITVYTIDPDSRELLPVVADVRILRPVDDKPGDWASLREVWTPLHVPA